MIDTTFCEWICQTVCQLLDREAKLDTQMLLPANLLASYLDQRLHDFTDIVDGSHTAETVRAIFAVSALLARLRSLRVSII